MKTKIKPYAPNETEQKAQRYCYDNAISVSPGGTGASGVYTIDVNPNGECWYKSPETYTGDEIMKKYYNVCTYYYEKNIYNRN